MKFRPYPTCHWLPRIMSLLLLVLLAEMAIAVIGSGYSFRLTAVSFFLRLIPSLILALAIYIAWRRERAGGLLFILFGLTYYLITEGTFLYKLPLTIFFLVCGSLFLLSHRYCQKNK